MRLSSLSIVVYLYCTYFCYMYPKVPSVTIVFVIDQFPYRYCTTLKQFLHDGMRTFIDQGVVFANAHHPHGMTATATGHTALNTGAYADEHGIVGNAWFNEHGERIACDHD